MHNGIPEDIRWIIEAKVRTSEFSHEFLDLLTRYMSGFGKSTYSKKQRAKKMKVCHICARWTCNTKCRSLGMVSKNREDKLKFIMDGLSKESLDHIILTLETHSCGLVQRAILDLWDRFRNEYEFYSLGNLTLKDPVCQFIRKLDGKHILDP